MSNRLCTKCSLPGPFYVDKRVKDGSWLSANHVTETSGSSRPRRT